MKSLNTTRVLLGLLAFTAMTGFGGPEGCGEDKLRSAYRVLKTTPTENAINVEVTTNITIEVSNNSSNLLVAQSDYQLEVTDAATGVVVEGTSVIVEDRKVVFTPAAPLQENRTYRVTIYFGDPSKEECPQYTWIFSTRKGHEEAPCLDVAEWSPRPGSNEVLEANECVYVTLDAELDAMSNPFKAVTVKVTNPAINPPASRHPELVGLQGHARLNYWKNTRAAKFDLEQELAAYTRFDNALNPLYSVKLLGDNKTIEICGKPEFQENTRYTIDLNSEFLVGTKGERFCEDQSLTFRTKAKDKPPVETPCEDCCSQFVCEIEPAAGRHVAWFSSSRLGLDYVFVQSSIQGPSPINYYYQDSDGNAHFQGVIESRSNPSRKFQVFATFGGYSGSDVIWPGGPKQNGAGTLDPTTWKYFQTVNGYFVGLDAMDGVVITFTRLGPPYQIGYGASIHDETAFGGSAWFNFLTVANPKGVDIPTHGNGDFNITFPACVGNEPEGIDFDNLDP